MRGPIAVPLPDSQALILNANSRSQLEMKRLKYLEYPRTRRRT